MEHEQGKCPKCGNDSLDYEPIIDDTPSLQAIYYPCKCSTCSFEGKEYYNLCFTEYTDEDDVPVK